jgi:hypothetical protein
MGCSPSISRGIGSSAPFWPGASSISGVEPVTAPARSPGPRASTRSSRSTARRRPLHGPGATFPIRRCACERRTSQSPGGRRGWGLSTASWLSKWSSTSRTRPFWTATRRLLRESGVLWISTPLGRGRGKPASDPFHVHQLRRSEVCDLFRDRWESRIFGQSGSSIESWIPGRRYRTILVRARPRTDRRGAEGETGDA